VSALRTPTPDRRPEAAPVRVERPQVPPAERLLPAFLTNADRAAALEHPDGDGLVDDLVELEAERLLSHAPAGAASWGEALDLAERTIRGRR